MGVNAVSSVSTVKSDTVQQNIRNTKNSPLPLVANQEGDAEFAVRFDKNGYPIADGDRLVLTPEETINILFIKHTKKAQYTYKANGNESLGDIKQKFNLKEGAIRRCNSHLRDDEHVPQKDYEIYFYKEDVEIQ